MAIDKNAVVKEAQKFAAKGQYDKAIAEWKKIAKVSPNDANVFNTIGDLCLKKNAKPEAVEAYKRAADILASDGFTSKAIALYKKVLNIDPKKIEAHLALADLNAEKGLTSSALESYKLVADHYTHNKETAKALGIYQRMADLNPSNLAFRLKLADMYAKEGMKKEAIKAYLQAADVHVSKEGFKDARQLFEKALALDPNSKEVYHKAGLVYFKEGKFVEACKALKPAFDSDPSNKELADIYLDALAKAGRGAEAEEAYQKLLSQDPGRTDVREKLYQLYLSQKNYDKAFAEVSTLANLKIESKDLDAAEQILKGFIQEAPQTVDGRRALSALYKTVGKGNEAAGVLADAADILIKNGDKDGAKDVLAKALELAPGHSGAQKLLNSIGPPAAAAPAEPIAAPQRAESSVPAAAPLLEEDPAITEAFTEVDVLVKYGLATKAIEQLESMTKKFPESTQIRIKLRDLYGDQGNITKAIAHMLVLADLYEKQDLKDNAEQVLKAALEMDPDNGQVRAKLGMPAPAPAPEPIADTAQPALQEFTFEEPPAQQPQVLDEAMSSPGPGISTDFETAAPVPGEVTFGENGSSPPAAPIDQDIVREEAARSSQAPEEISFDQPFEVQEAPIEQPAPAEPPATAPEPQKKVDVSEIWAEAEFYYQQGLFDEARKHYQKILEHDPDNREARDRISEISREQEDVQEFSKLADAVDGLEKYSGTAEPSAGEMAASASDEEAVRLLMQEIAALKQKPAPPVKQQKAPAPPVVHTETDGMIFGEEQAAGRPKEEFFDLGNELSDFEAAPSKDEKEASAGVSDDFFDLAAELRDELSSITVPPPSAEEQSLDDIFEEFKKGVEQQAIKEDTDTHYNLGVAYKEMGLLDDAIAEFILTPEQEPKFGQSRYMLGLCYMEKGDYQNAITEIEQALTYAESDGADWDRIGMWYDLGLAYQGVGDNENALRELQKVYSADPTYRDAADKIKELEKGGSISLEQLKDDIEKEISSKFLEEGERIEREEKTKKNEKVRR